MLFLGQTAAYQPDIEARVFRGQLKQLLHEFCTTELLEGCCPTCKSSNFKSMECHMLIFSLSTAITVQTVDDIDKVVHAEIPTDEEL